MRINKYIARSGLCSRRKADQLILDGKIKVNGEVLKELGYQVKNDDLVYFEDQVLKPVKEKIYYILNKPVGFVCTNEDRFAEKTIFDLIKSKEKLFSIGRLDADSRGLIIITNDGDLYNRIMHPRRQVFKEYEISLDKDFNLDDKKLIEEGVDIGDYITSRSYIKLGSKKNKLTIKISEGKNRQIRRMFDKFSYKVLDLNRIAIEDLKLENLKLGQYRELTEDEIDYLYSL
ncbi:MAG: pseudouridine synthase [Tissierellia bacterium]|nr:pseudouridine synthase [Tissierellia bacterium]